jgi:hypothetical protein
MIIGAMCIDEAFRDDLFTPPPDIAQESHYEKVARVLREYAGANDFTMDDSVVPHVLNVVRSDSNCRVAALAAFAATKGSICHCWPC